MHTLSKYFIEIYSKSSMYGRPEIKITKIKSTKYSNQCVCSVSQSHNQYGVQSKISPESALALVSSRLDKMIDQTRYGAEEQCFPGPVHTCT